MGLNGGWNVEMGERKKQQKKKKKKRVCKVLVCFASSLQIIFNYLHCVDQWSCIKM